VSLWKEVGAPLPNFRRKSSPRLSSKTEEAYPQNHTSYFLKIEGEVSLKIEEDALSIKDFYKII
jgi:hypothetical protein